MMSGYKSPRELAESHFNTPAPSARDRAFGELEAVKADRDEKTRQLREARLARDAQDTKKP
jgi:hypothetical protein